MRAVWYDRPGPAADVLQVGELPDPVPGPGEVRVRLSFSGINPGDTRKRADWMGYGMPYPRVIPHSDGAGVIESVGEGVDPGRQSRRVWVYGAQSYRPYGTAAQLTVVPVAQAVDLPPGVSDELGASLGIPGITAHRAVFAENIDLDASNSRVASTPAQPPPTTAVVRRTMVGLLLGTGQAGSPDEGGSTGCSEGRLTTMASCVVRAITTTASPSGSGFSSRCGTHGGTKS